MRIPSTTTVASRTYVQFKKACAATSGVRSLQPAHPLTDGLDSVTQARGLDGEAVIHARRDDRVQRRAQEDRLDLIEAIQESLPAETQADIDAAWKDEIVRRVRSIKDGSAVLVDVEDVDRAMSKVLEEG